MRNEVVKVIAPVKARQRFHPINKQALLRYHTDDKGVHSQSQLPQEVIAVRVKRAKKAKDIMVTRVATVTPSTPIAEAARLMVRRRLSALPVVDEQDRTKVVGIVTETDLLAAPETAKEVAKVMKKRVITVSPDTPISEVAQIFAKQKVRQIPVVEQGRLVGIISLLDVIAALHRIPQDPIFQLAGIFRSTEPGWARH